MTVAPEIGTLMSGCARGDRGAEKPLFTLLAPLVLRACQRGLPCKADAQDAAQEALLTVFRQLPRFDPERDGLAWILAIAHFEVLTSRRRRQRRREEGGRDLGELPSAERDVEDVVARRQLQARVARALDRLSPNDRALLEAARGERDQPVDARTRKRKQRALERLQREWTRLGGAGH